MQFKIYIFSIVITLLAHQSLCSSHPASMDDSSNDIEAPSMPLEKISSKQCAKDQCLLVGMQRYSEARCEPLGEEGNFCRVQATPENLTLHYPNKIVEATDIYTLFCPCKQGLECIDAKCQPNL